MIVVSDTGPLIALAKIERLELLQQLGWTPILIPPVVEHELFARKSPEMLHLESAMARLIQVQRPGRVSGVIEKGVASLDLGEREAVLLAASAEGKALLLMDDRAGRKAARSVGLPVIGILGLLLAAKKRNLIQEFKPLAEELRRRGYWISDALLREASRNAGET